MVDPSEIEHALDRIRILLPDFAAARLKGDNVDEETAEWLNREAQGVGDMLRTLTTENLLGAVAVAGGNIEDPHDLFRLKDTSTACSLAFTLRELAAACEAWGIYDIRPLHETAVALYRAWMEVRGEPTTTASQIELATERLADDLVRARARGYVERMEKLEVKAALEARSAPLKAKAIEKRQVAQVRQQKLYGLLHDTCGYSDQAILDGIDQRTLMRRVTAAGAMAALEKIYPPSEDPGSPDYPISKKASSRRRTLKDDVAAIRSYLRKGQLPWNRSLRAG